MASIPCSVYIQIPGSSFSPSPSSSGLRSPFLALTRWLGWLRNSRMRAKLGPGTAGLRARCWFRFGTDDSQSRDDFDQETSHSISIIRECFPWRVHMIKLMETVLKQNIHPVDILLMLTASEGDKPKIEELLRAVAKYEVKDADGKTALDKAASDEIKDFILGFSAQKARVRGCFYA